MALTPPANPRRGNSDDGSSQRAARRRPDEGDRRRHSSAIGGRVRRPEGGADSRHVAGSERRPRGRIDRARHQPGGRTAASRPARVARGAAATAATSRIRVQRPYAHRPRHGRRRRRGLRDMRGAAPPAGSKPGAPRSAPARNSCPALPGIMGSTIFAPDRSGSSQKASPTSMLRYYMNAPLHVRPDARSTRTTTTIRGICGALQRAARARRPLYAALGNRQGA